MNGTRPEAQSQPKQSFSVDDCILSLAYCRVAFMQSSSALATICSRVNIKYTVAFMTTQSILQK